MIRDVILRLAAQKAVHYAFTWMAPAKIYKEKKQRTGHLHFVSPVVSAITVKRLLLLVFIYLFTSLTIDLLIYRFIYFIHLRIYFVDSLIYFIYFFMYFIIFHYIFTKYISEKL